MADLTVMTQVERGDYEQVRHCGLDTYNQRTLDRLITSLTDRLKAEQSRAHRLGRMARQNYGE